MLDPDVDDVVADVEALREFVDAELVGGERRRRGDAVLPAQPANLGLVERLSGACEVAGVVEVVGELRVGVRGPELVQDVADGGRARVAGGAGAQHGQLVTGAGAPVDPDAEVGLVGSEGQGDVGDEGAQQPLAVAVRGRRCGPQAREVAGERFDVGARRRRGLTGLAGEFGVGVGELAEFGFPAGLEAARDEPVVGVALVKRAFGAGGVIAGSFGAQLDGAGRAAAAVGDRVGCRQRERDLVGRDGGQQPLGDGLLDEVAHDAATAGRADRSMRL